MKAWFQRAVIATAAALFIALLVLHSAPYWVASVFRATSRPIATSSLIWLGAAIVWTLALCAVVLFWGEWRDITAPALAKSVLSWGCLFVLEPVRLMGLYPDVWTQTVPLIVSGVGHLVVAVLTAPMSRRGPGHRVD